MRTPLIEPDDVNRRLRDPDWLVVDCRFSLADFEQGRRLYRESHIEHAIYAHLNEDLSGPITPGVTGRHPLPDVDVIADTFSRWGIDETVQVVAYDDAAGSLAARLWWLLRWLGHDAVAVLNGGWAAWREAGLPVSATVPSRPARRFTPRVRADMVVDAGQVNRLRVDPGYIVIDARAPERYRGEQEPIDPVAGHIPGARSVPFSGNLGKDGKMGAPDDLRQRFEVLFKNTPVDHVVSYCGSGVTACHNLLAIAHAGLGDARLYPGSWSEWITDPARPVATGGE
jgi:thiosulfate/3-mercaptopyruvate sulfurtransferase